VLFVACLKIVYRSTFNNVRLKNNQEKQKLMTDDQFINYSSQHDFSRLCFEKLGGQKNQHFII
jgi:hypothetical protein